MDKEFAVPHFFLGANSPSGFVSRFDHLYDPDSQWFAYILKGGPGTGKSTLMKHAAKECIEAGIKTELIYCSSDPDSLDAVIFPDKKICIVDGTPPHVVEPRYPGVAETIVNLGECWSLSTLLQNSQGIIEKTRQNSLYHKRADRYLAACGALHGDTSKLIEESINQDKIIKYVKNFARNNFPRDNKEKGREKVRILSAITPDGFIYFDDTISMLCKDLYVIEDIFGCVSHVLLSELRDAALRSGLDIITCYCPMAPLSKIESILIPSVGIAFAVSNYWHPLEENTTHRKIHTRRFIDNTILITRKQRLNFNRKMQTVLMKEAIYYLSKAKAVHDELEALYRQGMNYAMVDKAADEIIRSIQKA